MKKEGNDLRNKRTYLGCNKDSRMKSAIVIGPVDSIRTANCFTNPFVSDVAQDETFVDAFLLLSNVEESFVVFD